METLPFRAFVRQYASISSTVCIIYRCLEHLLQRATIFGHQHLTCGKHHLNRTHRQSHLLYISRQDVQRRTIASHRLRSQPHQCLIIPMHPLVRNIRAAILKIAHDDTVVQSFERQQLFPLINRTATQRKNLVTQMQAIPFPSTQRRCLPAAPFAGIGAKLQRHTSAASR